MPGNESLYGQICRQIWPRFLFLNPQNYYNQVKENRSNLSEWSSPLISNYPHHAELCPWTPHTLSPRPALTSVLDLRFPVFAADLYSRVNWSVVFYCGRCKPRCSWESGSSADVAWSLSIPSCSWNPARYQTMPNVYPAWRDLYEAIRLQKPTGRKLSLLQDETKNQWLKCRTQRKRTSFPHLQIIAQSVPPPQIVTMLYGKAYDHWQRAQTWIF